MKSRQTRIIILIMAGLILFTSSLALLMYTKQAEAQKHIQKQVEVYVAARNIKKGELIGADAMLKTKLPQNYLDFKPLSPSEIMGRYAQVDIYSKEVFRPEFITLKKEQKKVVSKEQNLSKKVLKKAQEKHSSVDTFTVSLDLFKNIDPSLKKGDFIDIVSVQEKRNKNAQRDFRVRYVAVHIPIYSFIDGEKFIPSYIQNMQTDKAVTTRKADGIVLQSTPKDIKNLLALHYETQALNRDRVYNTQNKGHLWIVKCAVDENKTLQAKKEKMLADYVPKYVKAKRKKVRRKEQVSISYEK